MAEEKDSLIEAVLSILRANPRFSKIEEKNVKKILRKLEREDLVYLANTFDVFREFLERKCPNLFGGAAQSAGEVPTS